MFTYPSQDILDDYYIEAVSYMHPNRSPWIVFEEEVLSESQCMDILRVMFNEDEYKFPHCNAHTRESRRPLHPVFDPIAEFLLKANDEYWQYDLGEAAAWMQTYFPGNSYQHHMDGAVGQTRKLTAVVMLTAPIYYEGGELEFYIPPNRIPAPNTLGSIAVFPHWVIHQVLPITQGMRQTINLGYWGPPFR